MGNNLSVILYNFLEIHVSDLILMREFLQE